MLMLFSDWLGNQPNQWYCGWVQLAYHTQKTLSQRRACGPLAPTIILPPFLQCPVSLRCVNWSCAPSSQLLPAFRPVVTFYNRRLLSVAKRNLFGEAGEVHLSVGTRISISKVLRL